MNWMPLRPQETKEGKQLSQQPLQAIHSSP